MSVCICVFFFFFFLSKTYEFFLIWKKIEGTPIAIYQSIIIFSKNTAWQVNYLSLASRQQSTIPVIIVCFLYHNWSIIHLHNVIYFEFNPWKKIVTFLKLQCCLLPITSLIQVYFLWHYNDNNFIWFECVHQRLQFWYFLKHRSNHNYVNFSRHLVTFFEFSVLKAFKSGTNKSSLHLRI